MSSTVCYCLNGNLMRYTQLIYCMKGTVCYCMSDTMRYLLCECYYVLCECYYGLCERYYVLCECCCVLCGCCCVLCECYHVLAYGWWVQRVKVKFGKLLCLCAWLFHHPRRK